MYIVVVVLTLCNSGGMSLSATERDFRFISFRVLLCCDASVRGWVCTRVGVREALTILITHRSAGDDPLLSIRRVEHGVQLCGLHAGHRRLVFFFTHGRPERKCL